MRKFKAAPQIFLSYAHEDKKIVEELYQNLLATGFKPWMDTEDILPGEVWQKSIQDAIENSQFFLACLSNNSVNKRGGLQKEFKAALDTWQGMLDSDIYLIPVRLDECLVPESMERFQWVDLFEENGFARLEQAIKKGMQRRIEIAAPAPSTRFKTINNHKDDTTKQLSPQTKFYQKAFVKVVYIIFGLLLAITGIPWLYNHYIYRVHRPDLPATCQASARPVHVGVAQLMNCPGRFQEQLVDNWKGDFSVPTIITETIESNVEAKAQTGFDMVVWGACEQTTEEQVRLNYELTTSRRPYNTFEPENIQVTDNLTGLSDAGLALLRYQHGDYQTAARLFGDLPNNKTSAELAFIEANSWLFAEQYENAILKFEDIIRGNDPNLAGVYNNLGVALLNTEKPAAGTPYQYQGLEQLNQAVKIAEDKHETDLELLARVNRSFLFLQGNSWENAREDCDAALKLNAQSALPHFCLARYYFSYYNKPARLGILPLNEINQQLTEAENMKDVPPLVIYLRAEWHLEQYLAEKQEAVEAYRRYFAAMENQACLQIDRVTLDNASRKLGEVTIK